MSTGTQVTGTGVGPSNTIALAIAQHETGTALAVELSEPANSAAVWRLVVEVQTPEGVYVLGAVRTLPPASGDPAERVVLLAGCPGAIGWRVTPYGPAGAVANLRLSSSRMSIAGVNGGASAVTPCNGSRLARRRWPAPPAIPAIGAVIQPTPGSLTKLYGNLDPAAGGGVWFMLFDLAALPLPGAAPRIASWPLAAGGAAFSFIADPDGVPFDTGIVWAISGAATVYAAPPPGNPAIVQVEVY